jgi:hypothetical protein
MSLRKDDDMFLLFTTTWSKAIHTLLFSLYPLFTNQSTSFQFFLIQTKFSLCRFFQLTNLTFFFQFPYLFKYWLLLFFLFHNSSSCLPCPFNFNLLVAVFRNFLISFIVFLIYHIFLIFPFLYWIPYHPHILLFSFTVLSFFHSSLFNYPFS